MEPKYIKDAFENTGHALLFDKFQYKLYVSGLFDKVEHVEIIEDFLECYQFNPLEPLLFDEFSFFFKTFLYSARFKTELGATDQ